MKQIGDDAEQAAADYLSQQGLKILDRNWRAERGELDIVARYKQQVHFVEVKARNSGLGEAWLAVGVAKQRRLQATALQWIEANGRSAWGYQFDVVAVSRGKIEWRQNVIGL